MKRLNILPSSARRRDKAPGRTSLLLKSCCIIIPILVSLNAAGGDAQGPLPSRMVASAPYSKVREGFHVHVFWHQPARGASNKGKVTAFSMNAGVPYPSQRIISVTSLHPALRVNKHDDYHGDLLYRLRLAEPAGMSGNRPALLGFAAEVRQWDGLSWVLGPGDFPRSSGVPDALKRYLVPTARIDYTSAGIRSVAADIAKDNPKWIETVLRTWKWVNTNIRYGPTRSGRKASEAFAAKSGRCGDFSRLTIALLRANGIPARAVFGLGAHPWISVGDHMWVEAWIPDVGWIAVQPQISPTESRSFPQSFKQFYVTSRLAGEPDNELEKTKRLARGLSVFGAPNGIGAFIELPADKRPDFLQLLQAAVADESGASRKMLESMSRMPENAKPMLLWIVAASNDEAAAKSGASQLIQKAESTPGGIRTLNRIVKHSPTFVADRFKGLKSMEPNPAEEEDETSSDD